MGTQRIFVVLDEEVTAADVDLVGEGDGDGSARAGDIEINKSMAVNNS